MKVLYFVIFGVTFFLKPKEIGATPVRGFSDIAQAFSSLKNIEISYSENYKCFASMNQQSLGRKDFERFCCYTQYGAEWRYENVSKIKGEADLKSVFCFKNGFYKGLFCNTEWMTVTKSESLKEKIRVYNPMFSCFSFLYDVDWNTVSCGYLLGYNKTLSSSPFLYDLNEFSDPKKCDFFLKKQKLEQADCDDPLAFYFIKSRINREGKNEKIFDYLLKFKTPQDSFPFEMEKRNSEGNLVMQIKVLSFENYQGISFPKEMKISRFKEFPKGEVDSESVVKLESIKEVTSSDKIQDIDSSLAKTVFDEVRHVTLPAGEYK